MWVPVQILSASLPTLLSASAPRKAEEAQVLTPATLVGDPGSVSGSRIWPGPSLAVAAQWITIQSF